MKKPVYLLILLTLLMGCSKVEPYYRVAQGARAYANGDYYRANIAYIEASKSLEYEHWTSYNLGTVYYALGEIGSAESEWQVAKGTLDDELGYRVFFNHGVLLFERGEYTQAYDNFRNALEIRPSGIEAKINLELTMEKMKAREGTSPETVSSQLPEETSAEIDLIMNYLKKIEGAVWESTEILESEALPRDL